MQKEYKTRHDRVTLYQDNYGKLENENNSGKKAVIKILRDIFQEEIANEPTTLQSR